MGVLTYYGKFIPKLSMLVHPLYQLLHADTPWVWSPACEEAFAATKNTITSADILVHYNLQLPLILAADASA